MAHMNMYEYQVISTNKTVDLCTYNSNKLNALFIFFYVKSCLEISYI